jgi:hypothetical protein
MPMERKPIAWMGWSAVGGLLALGILGCAGPVDVVLELSGAAPREVTATAQWGEPSHGFLPSRGPGVVEEAVPVVALAPGQWAARGVPRTHDGGLDLASVRISWIEPEPAAVTVRFSERAWADEGRRHHVVSQDGAGAAVAGWAGFDDDVRVTVEPDRLLREVRLAMAVHRRLPSDRSSIEEAGTNRLDLWLREPVSASGEDGWDLAGDPLDIEVWVVPRASWATVPWTYRRAGSEGGYAVVEQQKLAWLAANGQRANIHLVPRHPIGLILVWTQALPEEQVYVVVARRRGDALAWVGAMAPKYRGLPNGLAGSDGSEFDPEMAVDPAF